MLTKKDIDNKIVQSNFSVFDTIGVSRFAIRTTKVLIFICLLLFALLFLPWTQNLDGYGKVTTISAQERPQKINAMIDARIKNWYIAEGSTVKKGDTLLQLEEIKEYYLDEKMIIRNKELVRLKDESVQSYDDKIEALTQLIETLKSNKQIKLNQAQNKLNSARLKYRNDSALYIASEQAFSVAEEQFDRARKMKEKGIIAQYEFENRSVKYQQTQAKLLSAYNKTQAATNDIIIAENEIENVANSFNEKIAKASSDLYSAEIALLSTRNELVKQENKLANLIARAQMYYVVAPQNGFISNTISSGIGEVVKKGQQILNIVPTNQNLSAEIYVKPIDIPLLQKNQEVRLVFDGWPSIVFSGWPGASVGTFSAEVYSIDRNISSNGKYRVLVTQLEDQKWPKLLQIGSGVHGYALLSDVPIWYELWRQLNGFPANFYKSEGKDEAYKK